MVFVLGAMIRDRRARLTRAAPVAAPPWILVLLVFESLLGVAAKWFGSEAPTVRAYIDPGSGALLVQVLLSAVVGSLLYLERVRRFLRRLLPWPRRPDGTPSDRPSAK